MRKQNHSLIYLASVVSLTLLCAGFLALVGSCSSDSPPASDTGPTKDTTQQQADSTLDMETPPLPDIGQPADQYVWPDTAPPVDTWPHPTDSYSSTPFGCTTDADCFGHRCCPTPWGVKLCAPSCS